MDCKESLLRKQERDTQLRCWFQWLLEKLQGEVGGSWGESPSSCCLHPLGKVRTSELHGGLVNLGAPGQRGSLIMQIAHRRPKGNPLVHLPI